MNRIYFKTSIACSGEALCDMRIMCLCQWFELEVRVGPVWSRWVPVHLWISLPSYVTVTNDKLRELAENLTTHC